MIQFDDFKKVEMKIGTIEEASPVENSEKLLKLSVDFGGDKRQVLSGIAQYHKPENLIGKQFVFVTNLEPRSIMGIESQAMILATDPDVALLQPTQQIESGSSIR